MFDSITVNKNNMDMAVMVLVQKHKEGLKCNIVFENVDELDRAFFLNRIIQAVLKL